MNLDFSKGEVLREEIKTAVALRKILENIHQNTKLPILVQLFSSGKHSMIIGLGYEMSVLSYHEDNENGPYYCSLNERFCGKPFSRDESAVDFYYFGADSEISERNFIDINLAIESMCFFMENDTMPTNILWEQS
ncbi:MAG: hypothetical protein LBK06_07595 [Planctomycetaceae bacterium]|jgi:hypothetical protein|nr:hypothetical protein [Planctomycetaceae bacterium]